MGLCRAACVVALLAMAAGVAQAQSNPDFDAVAWSPLGCNASPLTAADPRGEVNLVGDQSFPAAYVGEDTTYLYMRFRVDGDPRDTQRGFVRNSDWAMIIQVPSGNPLQYQYQLTLNGDGANKADTVELWRNDTAEDVTFDPLFTDNPETLVASQVFDAPGVNTTPLARGIPTGDGSSFNGTPDWFVDVAFPITTLRDNGVAGSAGELAQSLFFPVTATSPNRHNKDWLLCPFLPLSTLSVDETVSPASVSSNVTAPVTYSIAARADGRSARGVHLTQQALPAPFVSFVGLEVAADDPTVTWTVVSTNPLDLRIPELPGGRTITVQIHASARFGCTDAAVSSSATAVATNAVAASGTAVLGNDMSAGVEICDGLDNNCDGQIDEGGDTLCDDGNICNGAETCGGTAGCQPGTPLDCDDHDACTTDSCGSSGCIHTPLPGCTGCQTNAVCDDHNPCTTDVCSAGVCRNDVITGCVRCSADAECTDADPCTDDSCSNGTCSHVKRQGCVRCTSPGQCDDGNQCTTDSCDANVCSNVPIAGCTVCTPVPEICNDGADNDCDGLVDCADPDCASVANCLPPPVEICGNCIDDDGNGLTDAEDPACCANPMTLGVAHLILRPAGAKGHGNRLKLAAQYAPSVPPLFNPLTQDTSIQLSESGRPLFCTVVSAAHWKRARRLMFRFADRHGQFAGGLDQGQFRIDRHGRVLFTARSRTVGMNLQHGSLRVTVRVGNECSQSTLALRPARKGLVFP